MTWYDSIPLTGIEPIPIAAGYETNNLSKERMGSGFNSVWNPTGLTEAPARRGPLPSDTGQNDNLVPIAQDIQNDLRQGGFAPLSGADPLGLVHIEPLRETATPGGPVCRTTV